MYLNIAYSTLSDIFTPTQQQLNTKSLFLRLLVYGLN